MLNAQTKLCLVDHFGLIYKEILPLTYIDVQHFKLTAILLHVAIFLTCLHIKLFDFVFHFFLLLI